MGSPINQLQETRDNLRRQLDANELFIAWVEADEAVRRAEAKMRSGPAVAEETPRTVQVRRQMVTASSGDLSTVVAEYLSEVNRPADTHELLKMAQEQGVDLKGQDQLKVFRSRLSKDPNLESIQIGPSPRFDRKWWLRGRPLPEGTTEPDLGEKSAAPIQNNTAPPAIANEAVNTSGVGSSGLSQPASGRGAHS